jgi:hypothetical protein
MDPRLAEFEELGITLDRRIQGLLLEPVIDRDLIAELRIERERLHRLEVERLERQDRLERERLERQDRLERERLERERQERQDRLDADARARAVGTGITLFVYASNARFFSSLSVSSLLAQI